MADQINWAKAQSEMLERIAQEAELFLSGMMQAAVSSDQRSATLGGVFIATATAIFGGLLIYMAEYAFSWAVVAGAGVCGSSFIMAAQFCFSATVPVDFHIAGNEPRNWYSDIQSGKPYLEALGGELENYQECIRANDTTMKKASRNLKWGAKLGIAAPLLGLAAAAIAILFFL